MGGPAGGASGDGVVGGAACGTFIGLYFGAAGLLRPGVGLLPHMLNLQYSSLLISNQHGLSFLLSRPYILSLFPLTLKSGTPEAIHPVSCE